MTTKKDNSKGKYRDLFTAHWTVKLSHASVEMAFVFDGLDGRTSNDGDARAKGNDNDNDRSRSIRDDNQKNNCNCNCNCDNCGNGDSDSNKGF
jgi:hypothetical protein